MRDVVQLCLEIGAVTDGMEYEGVIAPRLKEKCDLTCYRLMVLHQVLGEGKLDQSEGDSIFEGVKLVATSLAKIGRRAIKEGLCNGESRWTYARQMKPLMELLRELSELSGDTDDETRELFDMVEQTYNVMEQQNDG